MEIIEKTNEKDSSNSEIIKYKSLSDITTEIIRKEIITGKLSPGRRVTEISLSKRFGVSRNVIREGMIALIREGLLDKEKKKFTKVVEFNKKDISDIFDLRIALEVAAIDKYKELGLKGLNTLKSKSKTIDRLANDKKLNDMEKLVRNDLDFHRFIIEGSGNNKLINTWERLASQVLVLLYKYVVNRKSKDVSLSYDHDEIMKALEKGDINDIRDVVVRHINDTKYFLLNNY